MRLAKSTVTCLCSPSSAPLVVRIFLVSYRRREKDTGFSLEKGEAALSELTVNPVEPLH